MAVLAVGKSPGGEVVPAGAARSFRVRRDDLDAVFDEVIPILDVLRISLSYQEDDGRGVGRGIVPQSLLPILGEEAGLGDLVDVALKRERHHVGLQPVDDGAGLLARSAMRLLDRYSVAAFRFPGLDEGGIHVLVEFT